MLRAVRESGGKTRSNVVWNYGHTTIPRHLRDVAITEYGIADLRGRNDEACIRAMLAVSDARFQPALARSAIAAAKLAGDWLPAPDSQCNTPAHKIGRASCRERVCQYV